ncbi:AraC family transcriptional regulator [Streptomyces sp. TS71-3]|uniref:helix-turn-helix domain-containing protein n=1 Tax=Streptomyces sp. TS71-3 TaxID=2733862 RepID=UPI001B1FF435|nr:AraC family transcriptional regulator [Streptomyces sp. TS71-3]GHJ39664.1 AraC family transcriptional regulator [Streptomyces sp. TS71-3]
MAEYAARRGARTGATVWRARSGGPEQSIAPDGVMDLMWFRGRLVVAGPDTRTMVVETRAGEVTWGLQLAPGMAYALLGVPADELTDQRVDLSDLVALPGCRGGSFEADVDDAAGTGTDTDTDGAADALERVLVALWTHADPERSVLRLAASLDRAARRGLGVRETAELHGLPERSLRRLSNRLFGYGPKTLVRIHRFQHALHLARAGMPLSDASATAGYADQAHFNRESKRLTGQTPARLTRAT